MPERPPTWVYIQPWREDQCLIDYDGTLFEIRLIELGPPWNIEFRAYALEQPGQPAFARAGRFDSLLKKLHRYPNA